MTRYLVLGAGLQGAAVAYDLVVHGEPSAVGFVDQDGERLDSAVGKVRELTGSGAVEGQRLDAGDRDRLGSALAAAEVCVNCLPYRLAPAVAELALEAGTHYLDLGGNTAISRRLLEMAARHPAGERLCVLPDCGLAPGMGNLFAAHALERLGECETIRIRCGGLPERPRPPLDYMLVFSVEGLLNEYFGKAQVLRGGQVVQLETFTELEEIDFEGLAPCEAFVTSGGLGTLPWSLHGKVSELDYKTVRYRGHHAKFKVLLDLGLLEEEPVEIDGEEVVPRRLLATVLEEKLTFPGDRDLAVLRCVATSRDPEQRLELEIFERHDPETGFSAMQRTTGYAAAACAHAVAAGKARAGAVPLELAVDPGWFLDALERRGIAVQVRDHPGP